MILLEGVTLGRGKQTTSTDVASVVSLALHPLLIAPTALFLASYLGGVELSRSIIWAGLVVLLVSIPLAVFINYKLMHKHVRDADVSTREQRFSVYMTGLAFMTLCLSILVLLDAPKLITVIFAGWVLTGFLLATTTRFITKASLHTGVMTGATVSVGFYSWPWAYALAAATGLVAWSRLMLKRHTPAEVISGIVIASLVFLIVMFTQQ